MLIDNCPDYLKLSSYSKLSSHLKLNSHLKFRSAAQFLILVALLSACSEWRLLDSAESSGSSSDQKILAYSAEIRRTKGGIPHIKANDLGSLGFGTLYAMAEDNICILAKHYIMLGANKAKYFGPEDGNLESDWFHQLLINRGHGAEKTSDDINALFQGAAAGYNHYLQTMGVDNLPDAQCRGQGWVRPVNTLDVKRVTRADSFLDHLRPIIVAAKPPSSTTTSTTISDERGDLLTPLMIAAAVNDYLEIPKQGGSNAIAIGGDVSSNGRGLLLTNPHMPWHNEFQRFYPMHQTIPGKLDVMGANLVGRPRVGFGITENVAWTSTVSTAKRLSFYQLKLVPGKATSYFFDGAEYPMKKETVTVQVKAADGSIEARTHSFYSTHYGAMLVKSEFFDWTDQTAYAVRTLDTGWRGEVSTFDQYSAKTVRELKQIHNDNQFLMVNLIAADNQGEVLYTDPGPVPHISDYKMASCAVLRGAAFDGSRSDCQWGNDDDAASAGIFAPDDMPVVFRKDYVTNSNDSFWLSNPNQPLTGYPEVLGNEKQQRTLRTRSGLKMIQELLHSNNATDSAEDSIVLGDSISDRKISRADLQQLLFANENYAGEIIRDDLVVLCKKNPSVKLEGDKTVDLRAACDVLDSWDLHSNIESRGAHLFREFLAAANDYQYTRYLPKSFKFKVPFDEAHPLDTPRGLNTNDNPTVLLSLAKAIVRLERAGIALDAKLGDVQSVTRNGVVIPLHGGQEIEGVFNKVEANFEGSEGYPEVTRWSSSWIMATEFSDDGPSIKALLTYSLSANPDSPYFYDQTQMYSDKQWLDIPFADSQVNRAAIKHYVVQQP